MGKATQLDARPLAGKWQGGGGKRVRTRARAHES